MIVEKALFCYSGSIVIDENGNYYPKTFTEEVINRYFNIAPMLYRFGHIKMHKNDKQQIIENYKQLDAIEYTPKPNMFSIKGFKNERGETELIPIHKFTSIKGLVYKNHIFKYKLTSIIKECDYVIVRLPDLLGNMAINIAKKLDKPYIIELVGCPWDAYWNHSLMGKFIAPYMYFATKRRVLSSKYTVYVTNSFLQNRYPTKGKHTNCSNVNIQNLNEEILNRRINRIKNYDNKDKIIIGTTAALDVRFKGQEYIIEALGTLKQRGVNNFEYQLVGGGDSSYLRSIAEKYDVIEQVKFIGSLSHFEVFKWLDKIDLYSQPSRQEGLPRALIEAMSRGLPAFGANTAGIPELLKKEFIFSNSKANIYEICEILEKFNSQSMINQAITNFEESKKYDFRIIEAKRKDFFDKFVNNE